MLNLKTLHQSCYCPFQIILGTENEATGTNNDVVQAALVGQLTLHKQKSVSDAVSGSFKADFI